MHDEMRAAALTRTGEGEARWWLGALAVIRVSAGQTGGGLAVIEVTEPPGAQAPLHVHAREDETFWILEGSVRFRVGGREVAAEPGDVLVGPRGVPHAYEVGDDGCRMLFICTPGGFEEVVRRMSVPAAARTLPPPATEEPDWERIAAIAAAGGCEMVDE